MKIGTGVIVKPKRHESFEKMMRRFVKACDRTYPKEDLMRIYVYEKKSDRIRRKKKRNEYFNKREQDGKAARR